MGIIAKMRKQKAVWWPRLGSDTYGAPVFGTPTEVSCRWEDDAREFISPKGEKMVSRAVVYVDRVMRPGDYLRPGEYESSLPSNPLSLTDAFEIRQFTQLPNLKATETLLTAYL